MALFWSPAHGTILCSYGEFGMEHLAFERWDVWRVSALSSSNLLDVRPEDADGWGFRARVFAPLALDAACQNFDVADCISYAGVVVS